MLLWLAFALMTAAAIFAVLWPLSRRGEAGGGSEVAVYRDQLDEIARDRAAGLIGEAEGDAARIESTPYGIVIAMLLAELERQIAALSAALADGAGAVAVGLVRSIDATIHGLNGEIAIPVGSTLGRRLQALRADAAAVARSAIAA